MKVAAFLPQGEGNIEEEVYSGDEQEDDMQAETGQEEDDVIVGQCFILITGIPLGLKNGSSRGQ